MKALLRTSILFIFSCILLSACKKKDKTIKEDGLEKNAGFVTAKLNGKNWENTLVLSSYELYDPNYIGFIVKVFDGETEVQRLNFDGIDCRKKINKLHGFKDSKQTDPIVSFVNANFDQALAIYWIIEDSSDKNHVKIDSYDPATDMVSGTFQVSLYMKTGALQPGFTDTLHFTDGKFALKISPAR